jgi:hypothetical protein
LLWSLHSRWAPRPGLCAHTTVERQVHEEEGAGRAIYLELVDALQALR